MIIPLLLSPSRYYTVNRDMSADYYGVYGGPPYVDDYPSTHLACDLRASAPCQLHTTDRRLAGPWMREGGHCETDPYMVNLETLSGWWDPRVLPITPSWTQCRTLWDGFAYSPARSAPRSPVSSTGGPYSPHSFASPARSSSARFDRGPGRLREEGIYADPSVYGLRRSLSSPKVKRLSNN